MAQVVNPSKIDFGAPAAERDINHGLYEYFFESEAFQRMASGQKTLVLGNRGSGKSAIFKVLAAREKAAGSVVLELAPEDYSYEILGSVLKRENEGAWAKHSAFSAAWKFLILVLVMKKLTSAGPKYKKGAAARIYSYLRDNFKGAQDSPISMLVSYVKRIEGVKVGPYEAGIKTRELAGLYRLEELEPLIPDLKELCHARRVMVFVDELDRGWDNSEDAKAFVAGIVQASMSLNEISPNFRINVSLRQELYDNIPALYEDAQKYRDVIEFIRWDEAKLLSLIAGRIRHSVQELVGESDESCWNAVFVETLQYRQTKSFNYVVDRSLYRPREIIQFCTDALEQSIDEQSFPIDYQVISHAELQYSEARIKDIAAEYRFQYPGLLSVFEVFRGRTYSLERVDLEFLCLSVVEGEIRVDEEASPWLNGQDPEYLIEVLWRVGFLRAQAVGGVKAFRRSGSTYVGPHQVANLNIANVGRFQVHPMFRSFLGMKEAKG